jgi:pimeloyl-ACP methyl ester carboxylesterase
MLPLRAAPLMLLGIFTNPATAQQVGSLKMSECPGSARGQAECGTLTVWENREAKSGRTLDLFFLILPPTDPDPAPDPIYILTGGPGSAATRSADNWAQSNERKRRPILFMDQRGTGRSNVLNCWQPDDAPIDVYLGPLFVADHVATCREELKNKADLTQYTSPYSLADVEDLRAALGHEKINLIGSSYGTRAALVYLRQYESRVRSIVLQASMAMSQIMPDGMAVDAEAAVRGVLADCLASADCAAKYPNVEQDYRTAVERARRPVPVTITDPRGGDPVETTLQPQGFGEALRAMMYGPAPARDIPRLLHVAATEGDYSGFAQFAANRSYGLARGLATGMYLSITCAEDIPFANEYREYEMGQATFLADARARSHFDACRRWATGSVPDDFHASVESDVPVLVLNGQHDPVTPPKWGAETANHLPNSFHIVVPHGGHGWGGLKNANCVSRIQESFINRPQRRPDTQCLATIARQPFN